MVDKKECAALFKALGDENRLKLLELLATGGKNATQLLQEMNVVQSTLSHHLSILTKSGVVHAHKDGKWTVYALSPEGFARAGSMLREMTATLSLPTQEERLAKPAKPRKKRASAPKTAAPNSGDSSAGEAVPEEAPVQMDAWLL